MAQELKLTASHLPRQFVATIHFTARRCMGYGEQVDGNGLGAHGRMDRAKCFALHTGATDLACFLSMV